VVEVVVQAGERLVPARLSFGSGVANFVMNRREFTANGIILGVNPRGLADRSVPVLRIDSRDGQMLAVLFGASAHNTTLGPDNYQISGDYAGFAQTFIQEKLPKVQPMFVLGCAGTPTPPRGTMELAETRSHWGKRCAGCSGKLRPVTGRCKLPRHAGLLLRLRFTEELQKLAADRRNANRLEQRNCWPCWTVARSCCALLRPLTVWQFGRDLTLVGLSGEVVVDYVTLLEKALGPNQLWIAGYCNDVFGYLPSARVLAEGGYETRGLYWGRWLLRPRAEEVVQKARTRPERAAGRRLEQGRVLWPHRSLPACTKGTPSSSSKQPEQDAETVD
jgi:hypothetical protein